MYKALFMVVLGLAVSGIAEARNVHFTGDFESGQIQNKSSTKDGFFVHTLPKAQPGTQSVSSPDSTFAAGTNMDTMVVTSEVVGGETVTPRKGGYFLRSALYYDKNYAGLNDGLNKPRSKIYMSDPVHRIDHDTEGFVGFSIYTPKNFESELGIKGTAGATMLFVINSTASRSHVQLYQYAASSDAEAHWYLLYHVNAKSTNEDGSSIKAIDLGPVSADVGKWTDFVIRYRFNPFSTATNPAAIGIPNSVNKTYQGNKGILQVWKSVGSVNGSGNRNLSLEVDQVNVPIGLVPHATDKLIHYWRIYKYGWHNNPTTVQGPVWYGFDEIRQGLVARDGTGFADVNPSGLSCTVGCADVPVMPLPPTDVSIQ